MVSPQGIASVLPGEDRGDRRGRVTFSVRRLYGTYIGQVSSVDKSPHIENSESQDQPQVKLAHNALDLLVFARQLLCQCFLFMLTMDCKIVDLGLGLKVLCIEAAHGVRLIVLPKDL